jgi:hypothetical protein
MKRFSRKVKSIEEVVRRGEEMDRRLRAIARRDEIREVLKSKGKTPDDLEESFHKLMAAGMGDASWNIVSAPDDLALLFELKEQGLSDLAIAAKFSERSERKKCKIRKTLMPGGTGFFFCLGTGLGVGLCEDSVWVWPVPVIAATIALASVLLKSEHYQDYLAACGGEEPEVRTRFLRRFRFVMKPKPVKPNVVLYLCLAFGLNVILIFVVALLVYLIRTHT